MLSKGHFGVCVAANALGVRLPGPWDVRIWRVLRDRRRHQALIIRMHRRNLRDGERETGISGAHPESVERVPGWPLDTPDDRVAGVSNRREVEFTVDRVGLPIVTDDRVSIEGVGSLIVAFHIRQDLDGREVRGMAIDR